MAQRESRLVRNTINDLAPNNSNKAARGEVGETAGVKKEKSAPKLKPLVKKGNVVKKKKTVIDKFKESFLGESENLGDYIMYDVLVPAFRDTISDMGFGVIERLFGNGRSRHGRGSNIVRDRGRSYVSYNAQNSRRDSRDRDDRRELDRNSRARHDFENIVFTNKWEAEDVLAHMVDIVLEYNEVPVRAFYELSNMDSDYTDENYGWTNLRDAYVDRTRNGYIIVFPPTRPL
ncbi:MAG: hypothetical protein RBT15_04750 [Gudongella sp.]|jgi:hypothetical protein|nr:hypothetical protein [Gudongella sp.]